MIKEAIAKAVKGVDLTEQGMEKVMEEIMTGKATPAQVGSFITALRMKGETVDEITGAARVMRAKARKIGLNNHLISIDRDEINVEEETVLDTCGTGGYGLCGRGSRHQGGQTRKQGSLKQVRERRCT